MEKKQLLNLVTLESKNKFYEREIPLSTSNIDINKILVFNKVSFGKKSFF